MSDSYHSRHHCQDWVPSGAALPPTKSTRHLFQRCSSPSGGGKRHTLGMSLPSSCHCLLIFCSAFSCLFLSLSLLTQLGTVAIHNCCIYVSWLAPTRQKAASSYIQPFEIVLDYRIQSRAGENPRQGWT